MADDLPPASSADDAGSSPGEHDPRPEESPQDASRLLFRRYRVIRELGRGGVGVVFLAHDTGLEIPVAVKLMPELSEKDAEAIRGLRKEVLRGMALMHSGIVRTHNFESDESSAGIVMEYVEGDTLADLMQRQLGGCFEPEQILPWIEQLCAVLDYAHREANIVHRDLKPRNIMVTKSGRVKVADFGISAVLGETMSWHSIEGAVSGTLSYMSPQQAEGRRPSHLDDIHALGATIYELLTGKPPYFRGNQAAIFHQVLAVPPPSIAERREELEIVGREPVPANWEETVAACLAKDPTLRPQSPGEVLTRLRGTSSKGSADVPPSPEVTISPAPPADTETQTLVAVPGMKERLGSIAAVQIEDRPSPPPFQAKPVTRRPRLLPWALASGALVILLYLTWRAIAPDREKEIDRPNDSPVTISREKLRSAEPIAKASLDHPFINSLGMEFVPVPGTRVLFCRWETRRKDFEAFVARSGYDMSKGEAAFTVESDGWKQAGGDWRDPHFQQSDDEPVVCVSWEDAQAFCAWLSKVEGRRYRLPTDHEWSCAAGIGDREDARVVAKDKDGKVAGVYPWGTQWPPPEGAGNYADTTRKQIRPEFPAIEEYRDGFANMAPAGRFAVNPLGIYDLGGNVLEWCEDWHENHESRVLRGGSFCSYERDRMLTSSRFYNAPAYRFVSNGIRVVLED
jgi:serine/threonine protein kinase